jgi:Cu2+-exporting ATPase
MEHDPKKNSHSHHKPSHPDVPKNENHHHHHHDSEENVQKKASKKTKEVKSDLTETTVHGHEKAHVKEKHVDKGHGSHDGNEHHNHHAMMIEDFKKRFWVSVLLSIPVIVFSPMVQHILGYSLNVPYQMIISFVLSTVIFFYGGWPFLTGLIGEIRKGAPGMMTLIGIAISVAYIYSSAIVFGLEGMDFFWELATLIDVMLLGHWIEMKSVMGASRALELLVNMSSCDTKWANLKSSY